MTKQIYKVFASERIFYDEQEIEAESVEAAKLIYEERMSEGLIIGRDNEDFQIEVELLV